MSVDVQVGDVNIQASDRAFYGISDAVVNVVVSASSPSNPRKDAIVAYIDLAVVSSASNDNPGVLKFLCVAGTAAGSPVDPTAGTIQTAVGGTNPYVVLARVDVATSATTVVNANITDRRNPSALAVPYLYGGGSNTNGHLVPNVADDTVALLAATQTLSNKTVDNTNVLGSSLIGLAFTTGTTTTGITTVADITGTSTVVTIPSGGRRVMIHAWCQVSAAAAGTGPSLSINAAGSDVSSNSTYMTTAGTGNYIMTTWVETPSAGSRTYKLRGSSNNVTSFSSPYMLIMVI